MMTTYISSINVKGNTYFRYHPQNPHLMTSLSTCQQNETCTPTIKTSISFKTMYNMTDVHIQYVWDANPGPSIFGHGS